MKTLETLEEFKKVNASFPYADPVREWKEQGKKVIGWESNYVPEEVIYAAGMLPIRVTGNSKELQLENADAYLYIYTCSFARSCFELALNKQFDFLDGFVASSVCDGVRRLADNWRLYLTSPAIYCLSVPRSFSDRALEFYRAEVLELKKRLEQYFNVKISNDALVKAIEVYNKTRILCKDLYDLRKSDTPPISGAETLEVLNAAVRMPKGQFNQLLEKTVEEASSTKRALTGKVRLMIGGTILNNSEFIKGIEDLGVLVVVDAFRNGRLYWGDLVDTGGDPLTAISKRYLRNFPHPRMFPPEERLNRVVKLAKDFRVDGVVWPVIRYCSPYYFERIRLRDGLAQEGIPILFLDIEYGTSTTGQIKTRVQAFVEMILERGEQ